MPIDVQASPYKPRFDEDARLLVKVCACGRCTDESAGGAIAVMWITDSRRMNRYIRNENMAMLPTSGSHRGGAPAINENGEALIPLTRITQNL